MSRSRKKTQGQLLNEAFTQTGVSRRQLAIALLGSDATPARIASKKTQILRWINDSHAMSDDTARKVAAAFTSLGHPYTEKAFFKDPAAPRSWRDQMAEILARQDARYDEILEELRKLREAR